MSAEKNPNTPVKKRAPRKVAAPKSTVKIPVTIATFVGPEKRAALIAEAAYYRAEKRGFAPGHEREDWIAAEAEVDAKLLQAADSPRV